MDTWEGLAMGLALLGAAEEIQPPNDQEDEEESDEQPLGIHGTGDPYEMEHSQHGVGMPGWAR
jgi:hypothetical protein